MKTIWVPKTANHDLSPAEVYGEVLVVFDDNFSPFMLNKAAEVAAKATLIRPPKDDDFMLFCGPPTLNAVLVLELLKYVKKLNVLIYHSAKQIYIRRELYNPKETSWKPKT